MGQEESKNLVNLIIEQNKRLEEMSSALVRHIESEESAIKKFMEGFPGGDLDGHRRYHEALIKSEESRERMQQAIITKSLAMLVLFFLGAIGTALWAWFLNAVKTGKLPQP